MTNEEALRELEAFMLPHERPEYKTTPKERPEPSQEEIENYNIAFNHYGDNSIGVHGCEDLAFPNICGGGLIPSKGAWIMVTTVVNTEIRVPPMSIWYAKPIKQKDVLIGGYSNALKKVPLNYASIITPKGTLLLRPSEYKIIDIENYYSMINENGDCKIHFFSDIKDRKVRSYDSVNTKFKDQLHYLKSRGISNKEAYKMVLGNVSSQTLLYLTIHPFYVFYQWSLLFVGIPSLHFVAPKPIDIIKQGFFEFSYFELIDLFTFLKMSTGEIPVEMAE